MNIKSAVIGLYVADQLALDRTTVMTDEYCRENNVFDT